MRCIKQWQRVYPGFASALNGKLLLCTTNHQLLVASLNHFRALNILHNSIWIHHIVAVLGICKSRESGSQTSHSSNHIRILHPLRVNWASLRLTLLSAFKNCLVNVVPFPTIASVCRIEPLAAILTTLVIHTLLLAIRIVVHSWMFALTLHILAAKDRDVAEQLTLATRLFTIHLSALYIIEKMFLKLVTAEARTCWSNDSAVLPSIHVSPIYVKSIFSRLPYWCFIFFEFFLAHQLPSISATNNRLVF